MSIDSLLHIDHVREILGEFVGLEDVTATFVTEQLPFLRLEKSQSRYINLHHHRLYGICIRWSLTITFSHLTFLEEISLNESNLYGEFPACLLTLKNVKRISLSSNNLYGQIPKEIQKLSNLQLFDVSKNKFSGSVPLELWLLSKLESVYLHSNLFQAINFDLIGQTTIRRLNLSGNLFTTFDCNLFNMTPFIEMLDLENNRLITFSNVDELTVSQLMWLDIKHNNIKDIKTLVNILKEKLPHCRILY